MVLDKSGNSVQLPHCQFKLDIFKMTKIIYVEKLTADEGKKRLNKLIDLDDYKDSCQVCGLLCLLHKEEACMRSNHVDLEEKCQVWKEYIGKIRN